MRNAVRGEAFGHHRGGCPSLLRPNKQVVQRSTERGDLVSDHVGSTMLKISEATKQIPPALTMKSGA